ncbi:VanZ family protein [Cytobacillus suaedae]|nr:VanZ family protein [Cytobacillus suaedae]
MVFNMIKLIIRLLPILYMTFIWLQSSKFNPSQLEYLYPTIHPVVFLMIGGTLELAHLIQFGILYLLIVLAFLTYGELTTKKEIIALVIASLYGVIDEIHQYFVPYRSFSTIDIIKDIIGAVFFWYIIHKVYFKSKDSKIGLLLKRITKLSTKNKQSIHL